MRWCLSGRGCGITDDSWRLETEHNSGMRLEDGGWAGLRAGPGITGVTPSAVTRPGDQGDPGASIMPPQSKHRSEIQR